MDNLLNLRKTSGKKVDIILKVKIINKLRLNVERKTLFDMIRSEKDKCVGPCLIFPDNLYII